MRSLLAIAVALWTVMAADAVDRTSRVLPLTAAGAIRVDATIADLTVTGSNRSDVQIDVERRAPSSADLAKFPVVLDANVDGIRLSVVQANDGKDANLKSTITISAPRTSHLAPVRVFEGRVRLTNLAGTTDADLRRGPIEAADLAGRVRLEAGIGSVDVRDSELTAGGMMRLRVFNGPLRVRFPQTPANGRILAVTLNGSIHSDVPLTMKDQFGPRFGESTFGSGDPVMSMDVVKGDITMTVAKR
ncbi:MAG TPA: hypothetical protein VFA59_05785 [Vicinamibacterales bacterium]|nr:hypothetical protein [Vicinamibacterales bacterium]